MDMHRLLQQMCADPERLARFAAENPHLCHLLGQSWQGFAEAQTSRFSGSPQHQRNAVTATTGKHITPPPADALSADTPPERPTPSGDNDDMARLPVKPQATPIQHRIHLPPLPNANVGQAYDAPFRDPILVAVHCPADSGLHWAQGRLFGTPRQAGEQVLQIELCIDGQPVAHRHVLHVNPDPKSLWQNRPSNAQDPFYKPDQAGELLETGAGRLLAARVRGRSHAHVGGFCDDDYRLAYHPATGAHILAVSDGAGSAAFSRLGSQLAVNTAADTLLALLDNPQQHGQLPHIDAAQQRNIVENLFNHAIYRVLEAHEQAVAQHDAITDSKALSCTFLLALSLPCNNGHWLTAAYWIGDGAIACDSGDGFVLLGEADSGTYSGETQFLGNAARTPAALAHRTRLVQSAAPPILILLSDGVSDPKFETDANLKRPPMWQQLWDELHAPLADAAPATALQDWLGFWSPGNHDDRTLALFIPHTPAHNHSGSLQATDSE